MNDDAEHELEVRQGDVDAVLRDGIALRCRCGWEHLEPPPDVVNRSMRRHPAGAGDQIVFAMSARAEEAWKEHQGLDRG